MIHARGPLNLAGESYAVGDRAPLSPFSSKADDGDNFTPEEGA